MLFQELFNFGLGRFLDGGLASQVVSADIGDLVLVQSLSLASLFVQVQDAFVNGHRLIVFSKFVVYLSHKMLVLEGCIVLDCLQLGQSLLVIAISMKNVSVLHHKFTLQALW